MGEFGPKSHDPSNNESDIDKAFEDLGEALEEIIPDIFQAQYDYLKENNPDLADKMVRELEDGLDFFDGLLDDELDNGVGSESSDESSDDD